MLYLCGIVPGCGNEADSESVTDDGVEDGV